MAATLRAMTEIKADPQKGVDASIAAVPDLGTNPALQRAILDATIAIWSSPYTDAHGLGRHRHGGMGQVGCVHALHAGWRRAEPASGRAARDHRAPALSCDVLDFPRPAGPFERGSDRCRRRRPIRTSRKSTPPTPTTWAAGTTTSTTRAGTTTTRCTPKSHAEPALGPIDWAAWGVSLLGVGLGGVIAWPVPGDAPGLTTACRGFDEGSRHWRDGLHRCVDRRVAGGATVGPVRIAEGRGIDPTWRSSPGTRPTRRRWIARSRAGRCSCTVPPPIVTGAVWVRKCNAPLLLAA